MGWSGSLSGGKSKSSSSAKQDVWKPQGDALQNMYNQFGNQWANSQPGYQRMNSMAMGLNPYMQQIMQQAQRGSDYMQGGGSFGDTTDIRNALTSNLARQSGQGSNMGNMYESIVGGSGNTYIDPMVEGMNKRFGENKATMQNQTGMDAAFAGQGGSSRHAMQNAMEGARMEDDHANRVNQAYAGAYDKDLNMKMGIARMADTNQQAVNDQYQRMLSGADQNASMAMNNSMNMQNLGMGSMAPWMQAMQQPWNALNQWSNNMGDPTVLGSSRGKSSSWNAATSGSGSYM